MDNEKSWERLFSCDCVVNMGQGFGTSATEVIPPLPLDKFKQVMFEKVSGNLIQELAITNSIKISKIWKPAKQQAMLLSPTIKYGIWCTRKNNKKNYI